MLPALLILTLITAVIPGAATAQEAGFRVPPGRITVGDEDGLYLMLADGSGRDYIVEDDDPECWVRDGAWNPDGTQIIYTFICGGTNANDWRPGDDVLAQRDRTADVYIYDLATAKDQRSPMTLSGLRGKLESRWRTGRDLFGPAHGRHL
jgi:hypothetical protein